jgi:teichuronic acid biosynthesis glycosyltransferase TuaH
MNLVVIPFHDWKKCEREGFRTRDAHFMQEFEKHPLIDKLLVVNRPISLAEMALMRRNWRPREGTEVLQENDICITQVSQKTYTLDILIREFIKPLRMKRNWTPYIFGKPKVVTALKMALDHLGIEKEYALFMSAPIFVTLIEHLSPSAFAFDAQDNLLKHAFYKDITNLAAYYQFCLDEADFISTNSAETAEWFKQQRPDSMHIPNGVDDQIFNPDLSFETPADMNSISSPIVGYAGKMQEMFDVSLMAHAALELPDVNFVFIGQELDSNWMKSLWRYPNTYYLGDKRYSKLPQYLASFDICIIPYNLERQHGVDPIKFYEYLAMGKPIVTTNIGGAGVFRDYPQVRIADTCDAFLDGLRYFTNQVQQNVGIPKSQLPETILWRTKADIIVKGILKAGSVSNLGK